MKHADKTIILRVAIMKLLISVTFVNILCQTDPGNPLPQFLFPEFSKGVVRTKAGTGMEAILNYNMVDEEMVINQRGVFMVLDKPEEIDTVFLRNRKFIPVEKAFYEVVVGGPVSIFIQHMSRYAPTGSATAYGMTSQTLGPTAVGTIRGGNQVRNLDIPPNVKISPATIYWVRVNGQMQRFTTERQFLRLFPDDKADQIKSFIRKSNIDLKSADDLVRLGNFCNSVIQS